MRRSLFFSLIALMIFSPAVFGATSATFKTQNPDIDKYAFAKNFIVGLGYYHRVAGRLRTEEGLSGSAVGQLAAIKTFIDNRTKDNMDLRIARNYLTKYASSRNPFIRKVAGDAIATYDKLIVMSVEERDLWQSFYDFKKKDISQNIDDKDFVLQQTEIAQQRKDVAQGILETSQLIRIALLSAEMCGSEDCHQLAITQEERDKLAKKLDAFAGANQAWGVKVGQSTIEACEASVREVLEDPLYISK